MGSITWLGFTETFGIMLDRFGVEFRPSRAPRGPAAGSDYQAGVCEFLGLERNPE